MHKEDRVIGPRDHSGLSSFPTLSNHALLRRQCSGINMYAVQGHGICVLSHPSSPKHLAVPFWWRFRDSIPIRCWMGGRREVYSNVVRPSTTTVVLVLAALETIDARCAFAKSCSCSSSQLFALHCSVQSS